MISCTFCFWPSCGKQQPHFAEFQRLSINLLDLLDRFNLVVPNVAAEHIAVLPVEATAEGVAEAQSADLRLATYLFVLYPREGENISVVG